MIQIARCVAAGMVRSRIGPKTPARTWLLGDAGVVSLARSAFICLPFAMRNRWWPSPGARPDAVGGGLDRASRTDRVVGGGEQFGCGAGARSPPAMERPLHPGRTLAIGR